MSFSKEVRERLDLVTPAIVFFALPANQQFEILPTLHNEQKYDFPDGDLVTKNSLEVLVNAYNASLNGIVIRLITDESEHDSSRNLEQFLEDLLGVTQTICEYNFVLFDSVYSLESYEWKRLRKISRSLQQNLQIRLDINTAIISDFINYWLHA